MRLLDLTLPMPADNLACDEALMELAETEGCGEILRFWEPREYFVVIGYANHLVTEVNVSTCEQRGIPILRRCSGGGAVLQGPGCLNYSLILKGVGPLANITSANQFIMEKNRTAIEAVFNSKPEKRTFPIEIRGHTDLTICPALAATRHPLKFSGNAQRRRKRFLLFHGTFLIDFDLRLMAELLRQPSRQPDYRRNRAHEDFLVNLRVPADAVKSALSKEWGAVETLNLSPQETIASLVRDKYATTEWNFKF